eukprot:1967607-Prorocentrum_lima.AAC.1
MFRKEWDDTYRNRVYAQHLGDDEVMKRSLVEGKLLPKLQSALVDWSSYGRGWLGDGSGHNLNFHDADNPPPTAQTDDSAFSR